MIPLCIFKGQGRTVTFLPGGSHFGKINVYIKKSTKKIVSRKISFKKLFAQHWKVFCFVICLMPLFSVFGKVCGLDVSQYII